MPIPEREPRMVGRFFDDLDEVYDWCMEKILDANNRAAAKSDMLEKGGARLKDAGGKYAVMADRAAEHGKKFAYEDIARALEEISPYRKLKEEPEREAEWCPTCGMDLPRPMVPKPPPTCLFDTNEEFAHLFQGGHRSDEQSCDKEAYYQIDAPQGQSFSCKEHFAVEIQRMGGDAKVTVIG